jgi:2-polyprenyl-3-methyl-5-hydroxy-6-metoxy-1,4-benzoquinol methylase
MSTPAMPAPDLFFETAFAYQRTAALKSAVQLNLFTAIGDSGTTADVAAQRCGASERGTRILCDYLTVLRFLTKSDGVYRLTPESATFLTKQSPAYLGGTLDFLTIPELTHSFDDLTDTIRRGHVAPAGNIVAAENPIWVEFARAMVPMMMPAAHAIADLLGASTGPLRVLDIAAGHGMFGITIAQRNPQCEVVAVDWPQVLTVAQESARAGGVEDRYRTLPGDAFTVDLGTGYDIALVTNFLHHFDHATCTSFLRRIAATLRSGGRVAILEFVPNQDRVSPPFAAMFSLTMLAETPAGDAYTLPELRQFLEDAGFTNVTAHSLPTPQTVVIARR